MPCNNSRRAFLHQSGCGLLSLAAMGLAGDVLLPVKAIAGTGNAKEKSYTLPAADGVNIDRSTQVMLVRYANRIYAFSMACPHEHAAVKWVAKDRRFQCSKHDSQYTPDGTYTSGRATRNLDRFPIRREGDSVIVSLDRVFQSDSNNAAWKGAGVDV